jgi:hypothetical protein
MNRIFINQVAVAQDHKPLPSGEWANQMRDHYWRHGSYRPADMARLLGVGEAKTVARPGDVASQLASTPSTRSKSD